MLLLDFVVIALVNKAEFVGHGNTVEAAIEFGCLNDFFDGKDSIVEHSLVIRIADDEVDRHSHPFIQLRD